MASAADYFTIIHHILVISCVLAAVTALNINADRLHDLKERISDIKNQLHGTEGIETRSERLKQIVANVSLSSTRKDDDFKDGFLCGLCFSVVDELLKMRRVEMASEQYLKNLALELCVDFEIQSEEVCHGFIELNSPSIAFIIDNRADLTSDSICKLLLNDGDCINPFNDDKLDFSVDIQPRENFNKTLKVSMKTSSDNEIIIVHLTDVHVDFKYLKGASADCGEPACCREIDESNENDTESLAGHWGDYRSCDTPWHSIVDALQQIRKQHSVNTYYIHSYNINYKISFPSQNRELMPYTSRVISWITSCGIHPSAA
jgi:sphingomyelin phosphodiesterase